MPPITTMTFGCAFIPIGYFPIDDKALLIHDLLLFRNTQFLAMTRPLLGKESFQKHLSYERL